MALMQTTLDPGLRRDDSFKAISSNRKAISSNRKAIRSISKAISSASKMITPNRSKAITSNNATPAKAGVQCRGCFPIEWL